MNGGFTPCRQLSPYLGQEHTVFLIRPMMMMMMDGWMDGNKLETRKLLIVLYGMPWIQSSALVGGGGAFS